jgi:predicted ribosome quality control (RQC) complex YloA/Tae2 family protein
LSTSAKLSSLIIRADPDHLAVYLGHRQTDDVPKGRQLPPFSIQLRKVLGSARIDRIEKLGDDRVVEFSFHKLSESGEPLKLVASLTGRSADILLLEGEKVAASLRGRDLGSIYQPPKPVPDRVDPIDLPSAVWLEIVDSSEGKVEIAGRRLLGFNDVYCAELAFLSRSLGPERALQTLVSELCRRPSEPAIYSSIPLQTLREQPGIEVLEYQLASIPLRHLDGQIRTPFSSMSTAAERYFEIQDARQAFAEFRRNAASEIRSHLKKQATLHEKLSRDLANCENADRDQRLGEILLANLHNISKSGSDFLARDYFEPGEPFINIPDQNTSDARLAAEQYFRRSRKARRGVVEITKRLAIAVGRPPDCGPSWMK